MWGMAGELMMPIPGRTGVTWGDAAVTVFANAPKMRVLVGSTSVSEVKDRLEDFEPAYSTSVDESFAWAYSMLSPDWSDVWERGASFPAQWNGKTKKVFLMYTGSPNFGYSAGVLNWSKSDPRATVKDADAPNVVPAVCRRMAERGVAVHVLAHKVPGDELEDVEKDMFRTCASYGEALGSSFEGEISKDAVHDLFVELATRPGKVRITSAI